MCIAKFSNNNSNNDNHNDNDNNNNKCSKCTEYIWFRILKRLNFFLNFYKLRKITSKKNNLQI